MPSTHPTPFVLPGSALAQAAPGPNMMIVTLVGWHVAGWAGMLVTSVAKFGPAVLAGAIRQTAN